MIEDRLLANPFYAIEFAPIFAERHEPLVSEDTWIEANFSLIESEGAEEYLRLLLDILKGNYH